MKIEKKTSLSLSLPHVSGVQKSEISRLVWMQCQASRDTTKEGCDNYTRSPVSWFLCSSAVFRVRRKKIGWIKLLLGMLNAHN